MRYVAMVAASAAVLGFFAATRGEAAQAQARPAVQTGAVGQEDFRWSGRVARGQQIAIRAIVGTVRAEATSGDQVEVVGVRRGAGADEVRIEVKEDEDGITICTIHPVRPGSERERDDDDDDGPCNQSGDIDVEDARVDFVVRVPAGVKFAATTVSGDIIAEGLRNAVDVASVSGDVRVATTGTARAATVNGDVTASFGETDGDEMEFASVSGNVTVRMPRDVNAEVSAHTMSGEIESAFDLERGPMARGGDDDDDDGGFNIDIRIGESANGRLGRGGPELSVSTISGDIRLERMR